MEVRVEPTSNRLNHNHELQRLENILEYDIINKNDQHLFSLCKLAAFISKTAMSFISLVGYDYVDFISRFGSALNGVCRHNSMCSFAVEQDDFFEVEETLQDERFKLLPAVNCEIPLRYYGAWPLKSPEGFNIGVLCVCDFIPHKMDANKIKYLKSLSNQVLNYLVMQKQNHTLYQMKLRTERLSGIKRELMNKMGEDLHLKTTLNEISKKAEFLKSSKLDSNQEEIVDIIKNSSKNYFNLFNDITEFSNRKSDLSPKQTIERLPFQLRQTIQQVFDFYLLKSQEKGKQIKLSLEFDERIPRVLLGDKLGMNQILMNLVGNAIRYTEQGFVTLIVSKNLETEHQMMINILVKDTGVGMSQDKINSIFNDDDYNQFYDYNKYNKYDKYENSILLNTLQQNKFPNFTRKLRDKISGLRISKSLVQLHGGKLKVKSNLDGKGGSTFYFSINYNKIKAPEVSQQVEEDFSCLNNLHILVCEDNLTNIKLIEHFFHHKVDLVIAQNGKEAIRILQEKTFDAILMDIDMPVMGGIENTKYIRSQMNLKLPILGFTANDSPREKKLCLKIGMNDYIKKSFKAEEIKYTFESLISKIKTYEEQSNSENVNESEEVESAITGLSVLTAEELDVLYLTDFLEHVQLNLLNEFSGDDKDFEKDLIENFLFNFPKDIKNLELYIKTKNFKETKFWIHKIKSPLGIFGLSKILDKLQILNKLCENNFDDVKIVKIFKNIENNMEVIYNELQEILKSY